MNLKKTLWLVSQGFRIQTVETVRADQ